MSRLVPAGLAVLAAAVAVGALAVAPSDDPDASDALARYTDPGDACRQAVSAIGYLDDSLRALGQEPYQEFDDLVRSKLSAVGGTLALEDADWPDAETRRQARLVGRLAESAAAPAPDKDPARARTLLDYRIEAARLVRLCRSGG